MLAWGRSPNSLTNFETIKDCIVSREYQEVLLKDRLTKVSDFFPGEGGLKKNKRVSRSSNKIFLKSPRISLRSFLQKYNNKI
jgi:hypothetical protein